jgi:hypothetical protein
MPVVLWGSRGQLMAYTNYNLFKDVYSRKKFKPGTTLRKYPASNAIFSDNFPIIGGNRRQRKLELSWVDLSSKIRKDIFLRP